MIVNISDRVRIEFERMVEFSRDTSFETGGFLTGGIGPEKIFLDKVIVPKSFLYTFPGYYGENPGFKGNEAMASPTSVYFSDEFIERVRKLFPIGFVHTHPNNDEPFPSPDDLELGNGFPALMAVDRVQTILNLKGDFYVALVPWPVALTSHLSPPDKKEFDRYVVYRANLNQLHPS